ncbi:MAG TPA: SpoIIE family protein phosphatase [Acidimicrobiales bacterium]|nr:SpoIIE family protein phosphatase [Acidimicrobiales bacterium]
MVDEPLAELLEDSAEDLYENAPCGYLSTRPGGLIVKVNRTFLDWTGFERDDLVDKVRFQDLLTPGGRIFHETHYAPLLRMQGTVREIAVEIVSAEGQRLPVLVNSVMKTDDDGNPLLVRTTVFNAADRKAYEQELLWARQKAERSEARVRILQQVVADLAAAAGVADIADVTVRAAGDAFGAGGSVAWLLDADQDVLVRVASTAFPDAELQRLPASEPLAQAILDQRDLVVATTDDDYHVVGPAMAGAGFPAFAAVPLLADDRVLGMIAFGFREARTFAPDEADLLRTLGRHAGQAVERARLYEAERRLRRRADVLQRVTALLAAALAPDQIAAAVLDELGHSMGADATAFAVVDGDNRLRVLSGRGDLQPAGDPREASFTEAPCAEAVVPLMVEGRSIGLLALGFDGPRRFSKEERTFLLAIGTQCAQALERARLHEETAQRAERAAFLARTSRLLDEVPRLAQRARRLVELVVPTVADWAAVDIGGERVAATSGEQPPSPDVATLPLQAGGEVFGALVLVRTDGPAAELSFVLDLADRTAIALENSRLYEQQRDVAHALQRSMLAGAPPEDPRIAIASRYRPAVETLEVGGDWHDAFWVGADRIGIVVGDVVGRGIEAATAMGQLRSALRALAGADLGPAQVLERLDVFVEQVEAARVATVVYGELDVRNGRLRYACAGHLPPVLAEVDAPARLLWEGRSAPLGVYPARMARDEATCTLAPGSRLLLYTDGLVERRGQALDEGLDALAAEFDRRCGAPLATMVDELTDALLADEETGDDVCLLCVERR